MFEIEKIIFNLDTYHELSLLNCILKNNTLIHKAKSLISKDDFLHSKNGQIFELIDKLIAENNAVDFVSLAQACYGTISVSHDVMGVMECFATEPLFMHYIKQIKENITKKRILEITSIIIQEIKNPPKQESFVQWANDLNNKFNEVVMQLSEDKLKDDLATPIDYTPPLMDYYMPNNNLPKREIINTGYYSLDQSINGLKTLTVLCAPTGMGKTCLALNIFANIGMKENIPCLYLNFEMGKEEILDRIFSSLTGIESKQLKEKKISGFINHKESLSVLTSTIADVKEKNTLFFTDNGSKTIDDAIALIYHCYHKYKIKVVFVDYIGEITPDTEAIKEKSEYITYGRYTQTLKNVCADLEIKCILLSQIGREGDEDPQRKHIQGSWKIIQKADLFLILTNNKEQGYQVKIEKNRHGQNGVINFDFDKPTHTFTEKNTFNLF